MLIQIRIDIYIACVSSAHNVCPKGYWIAIVSTIAESSANHHLELQAGLDRLGKIEEQFMVRANFSSLADYRYNAGEDSNLLIILCN